MKKSISLLFILILSPSVFGQVATVVVNTKEANLRETPSVKSKIVGKVKKGDLLPVSANEGVWYYVTINKTRGWIHYTTIRKTTDKDLPDLSDIALKNDALDAFLDGKNPSTSQAAQKQKPMTQAEINALRKEVNEILEDTDKTTNKWIHAVTTDYTRIYYKP